jgi:hypothetical protein
VTLVCVVRQLGRRLKTGFGMPPAVATQLHSPTHWLERNSGCHQLSQRSSTHPLAGLNVIRDATSCRNAVAQLTDWCVGATQLPESAAANQRSRALAQHEPPGLMQGGRQRRPPPVCPRAPAATRSPRAGPRPLTPAQKWSSYPSLEDDSLGWDTT